MSIHMQQQAGTDNFVVTIGLEVAEFRGENAKKNAIDYVAWREHRRQADVISRRQEQKANADAWEEAARQDLTSQ